MQEKYCNALAEVDEILNIYKDDEYIKKIPQSFRDFITKNKSTNYEVNINGETSLKEQNILYETKVVLAAIYRDFLANDDEKRELSEIQRNKAIHLEEEKKKMYDPNKIFRNAEKEKVVVEEKAKQEINGITELTEISQETFWSKIINKVKRFLMR